LLGSLFFGNGHYFRGLPGCMVNRSHQNSVEDMIYNTSAARHPTIAFDEER
jgi:hypothetical protein